ncbi:MAG: hypothetical protein FJ379_13415 [Verrucomicrobia bacterium]|nr:hypothetical protein [Verrucomicrobiota bacterium]
MRPSIQGPVPKLRGKWGKGLFPYRDAVGRSGDQGQVLYLLRHEAENSESSQSQPPRGPVPMPDRHARPDARPDADPAAA